MTATRRYYLPQPTLAKLLDFLAESRTWINLRCDADELMRDLATVARTEASPDDPASILAELLGEVGRATGRTISTAPVLSSLEPARAALAEMAPVLGAKVLDLPRAVTPDSRRDIAAEVSRQLEQASGVDVTICESGETVRMPCVPRVGEHVRRAGGGIEVVAFVRHESGHVVIGLRGP